MPGFNGAGPRGEGPMTGRGLGPCNEENKTTDKTRIGRGQGGPGRGLARRRRRGFKRRWQNGLEEINRPVH